MADQPVIVLPPLIGGQAESWAALVELAPAFGDNWLLVGGQMVFLHELERQPAGLGRIHLELISAGFDQDSPGPEGTAHRYRRLGAVIDVLAPDNVGERAQLKLGSGRTIEAPGTSQAFHRCGVVTVEAGGVSADIRRPDLVGALLGKAAAVVKITSQSDANRAKHLRDFDSLARMLGPSDRSTADLSKSERRLLVGHGESPEISDLGNAALRALLGSGVS